MHKLLIFIFPLIFFSCDETDEKKTLTPEKKIPSNPLDRIKGDKIIDSGSGKIRENNFEKLKKISVEDLIKDSELYQVTSVGKNVYLLQQKKNYLSARKFNLILETDDKNITSYHIFNDYSISDIRKHENGWLILFSDHENENAYWKKKNSFYIAKTDSNFTVIWKYEPPEKKNVIKGMKIKIPGETLLFEIHVITICGICYSIAELELSNNGKFISVRETDSHNGSLTDDALTAIFTEN